VGQLDVRAVVRVLSLDDQAPGALREQLMGDMGLRREAGETVERRLLDSFDWRVWRAGAVLEHDITPDAGWLVWRRRAKGARPALVLGRQEATATPSTTDDLAAGAVSRLLAPVLQMRALLPRAVLTVERERFGLRDNEDKTVARVSIEHMMVVSSSDRGGRDLGWRIVIAGVRGHGGAFHRLVAQLEDTPGVHAARDDLDRLPFEAAGATPGDYSSKVRIALEPRTPTLQAFTTTCSALLNTIEQNERGVRENIDTEFLHDFRVSIRRTRAMLSQARGVVPKRVRASFGEEFRWLAGETSELRDLDVHLLGFDDLASQLAVEHRADLEPLRELLVDLQRDEHARLVAVLESPRYRDLVNAWRAFLDAPEGGDDADVPVGQAAGERIWKAYRSVVKHGRRIDDDSPAQALHDLRKRAKKLRYLLEAYRSLYAKADMKALLAELKALQDNLGTFQDCDVQITRLRQFAELLDERPGSTGPTALAMGLLTTQLAERQQQARLEFHARFARFDRRRNRRRFRRVFEPVSGPAS
jgi:CHAD domain-containing protein